MIDPRIKTTLRTQASDPYSVQSKSKSACSLKLIVHPKYHTDSYIIKQLCEQETKCVVYAILSVRMCFPAWWQRRGSRWQRWQGSVFWFGGQARSDVPHLLNPAGYFTVALKILGLGLWEAELEFERTLTPVVHRICASFVKRHQKGKPIHILHINT